VGCFIWYSEERTGWGHSPFRPLLAVQNLTAHPSVASVPITVLLRNGPLLCSFNVNVSFNALKGLMKTCCVWCSVSAAGDSVTSSVITTCVSSTLALQTSSHPPTVSLNTAVTAVSSSSSSNYTSSSHDAVVEQARQVRS